MVYRIFHFIHSNTVTCLVTNIGAISAYVRVYNCRVSFGSCGHVCFPRTKWTLLWAVVRVRCRGKKFTFAISSPDEFLVLLSTRKATCFIISVDSVSLCVCISVDLCLSYDNFRRPWRTKFIFAHPVYLQAIRVKFVYEGQRVKVKVSGAGNVQNPYSCSVNFDCPQLRFYKRQNHQVNVQHGVFDYCGSNGMTAIFVTWPEVTTCN